MFARSHITIAAAAMLVLGTTSARAVEDVVKPAATPAPTAGPTKAAAELFCGDAPDKAEALIQRYSSKEGLKEVYKSTDFIAYGDDPKNATVMYTFTKAGHAAHPTAVCRKLVQEGDAMIVKMHIVCEGKDDACGKLRNDFNVMTARMQADVDQKIAAEKK
jgi:hypothetical protein